MEQLMENSLPTCTHPDCEETGTSFYKKKNKETDKWDSIWLCQKHFQEKFHFATLTDKFQ